MDKHLYGRMNWVKISCILCMFGCFKDFRPSESFVTDYLTGPWKNFTSDEVNQHIYPVSTYSYLATLVLIFLITDFVRYKPIIVLCGLSGIVTFLIMILGKTLIVFQILEFFYGLFMSTEIAYYTYIYAKVDKKHYQEVTGHTKAAALFGRSMSGVVAQLTASFDLLNYHQLNFITLSACVFATVWSLFLPSVNQSIYFHRTSVSDEEQERGTLDYQLQCSSNPQESSPDVKNGEVKRRCFIISNTSVFRKIRNAYALLWKHFVQAYTNYRVTKWSIWWALATCGYLQVINYIQLLWQTAVEPGDKIYNGAVDFIYAIIGAVTVFCVGRVQLNWTLLGDVTLSIFSLLEGGILLGCSYSYNIWLLYLGYITFGVIYHTMVTVARIVVFVVARDLLGVGIRSTRATVLRLKREYVICYDRFCIFCDRIIDYAFGWIYNRCNKSFEVAKYISEDSYGLVFGVNTFFALVTQSLLTLVVVNKLMLNIRQQFFVYGSYFLVLTVVYIVMGVANVVQHYRSGKDFHVWVSGDDKSASNIEPSKPEHDGS